MPNFATPNVGLAMHTKYWQNFSLWETRKLRHLSCGTSTAGGVRIRRVSQGWFPDITMRSRAMPNNLEARTETEIDNA
ncbi:hypothetical protein PM082_010853 [Marasmius tenuissimus]|nr:hypothetical protein PM082_010853 [Marasmius tenuissimus]